MTALHNREPLYVSSRPRQAAIRDFALRISSLALLVAGLRYFAWRLPATNLETAWLSVPLAVAEACVFAYLAFEVVSEWPRGRFRAPADTPPPLTGLRVDIFVPVCGEPIGMLADTLRAVRAIRYPARVVVLNDGRVAGKPDWEAVEALCARFGIRCITRTDGERSKAGNLNHALTQTDGDFILCCDADQIPTPDILDRTLGYFRDARVGLVVTPQRFDVSAKDPFGNREDIFYQLFQPRKDVDNAAFSCGSGVVYRRAAVASIGGFSQWNIVEDLHTSYRLHRAGWRSVYHPEALTTGTAPEDLPSYANQRRRWALDSLRMLIWDNPLRARELTWRQRLQYARTCASYLLALPQPVFLTAAAVYLLLDMPLLRGVTSADYLAHALPYYAALLLHLSVLRWGYRILTSARVQALLSLVFAAELFAAIRGRKRVSGVTPKSADHRPAYGLAAPVAIMTVFNWVALVYGALFRSAEAFFISGAWTVWNLFVLIPALGLAFAGAPALFRRLLGGATALTAVLVAGAIAGSMADPGNVAVVGWREGRVLARLALAGSPASTLSTPPAPPPSGVVVGSYVREAPAWSGAQDRFERAAGRPMRIILWYQDWGGASGMTFPAALAESVRDRGAVPLITWEPRRPGLVRGVLRVDARQPEYRLSRIAAGAFDDEIRRWAQGARAWGGPVMLRFAHEMNGWWYPWAGWVNGNTPADFRAAWRRVHRIVREAGATNVAWVWTPNTLRGLSGKFRDLDAYYPGDAYVDWVGTTGFNWGRSSEVNRWDTFEEVFGQTLRALRRYDKPVIITEIASAERGGDKAAWIRNAFTVLRARYPEVRAVVWFNEKYDAASTWPIDSSRGALRAFREAIGQPHYGASLISRGQPAGNVRTASRVREEALPR